MKDGEQEHRHLCEQPVDAVSYSQMLDTLLLNQPRCGLLTPCDHSGAHDLMEGERHASPLEAHVADSPSRRSQADFATCVVSEISWRHEASTRVPPMEQDSSGGDMASSDASR